MVISTSTLMKIAALGGVIIASIGLTPPKINSKIAQTDYYQEAINKLVKHRKAKYELGEPIQVGRIDVNDYRSNYTRHLSAHYEVPVKGPKQKGVLHFWANRKDVEDTWSVSKMELQLEKKPNQRLLLVKNNNFKVNN